MNRFCCCFCCFEANETLYTEQSNGHMTIATCANAELVGEYLHYRRRFCVDALYVYYAFAGINVYYVVISSNICFCMATKAALEIDSLQYIFCWLFFILSLVFSFLLVQTGSARIHNKFGVPVRVLGICCQTSENILLTIILLENLSPNANSFSKLIHRFSFPLL